MRGKPYMEGNPYLEEERQNLKRRVYVGQRVAYSSAGESGINAGAYTMGTITNATSASTLVEVLFDGAQSPEWIDGRLLHLESISLPSLSCRRCGHSWIPRTPNRPGVCPKCKRHDWDQPRKHERLTTVMPADQLAYLIRQHGVQKMAEATVSYSLMLENGWDLSGWYTQRVPGAVVFYRAKDKIITDDPRILVVNAPESERAKWEEIAKESDAPTTVLMMPGGVLAK